MLFGCDAWAEPETEWHLWWKSVIGNISPRFIEKTIQKNGDRHRADAWFPNGTVYEFQHSPISTEEIHEREAFYGANGNLTWIFDAIEPFLRGRISVRSKDGYQTFRWKQARKSISACSANVFLDLGEALLHVKRIYSRPQRTYSKRINGHDVQVEQRAMFAGWGYVTDKADFVAKLKSDAKIFLESEISLEIESL